MRARVRSCQIATVEGFTTLGYAMRGVLQDVRAKMEERGATHAEAQVAQLPHEAALSSREDTIAEGARSTRVRKRI